LLFEISRKRHLEPNMTGNDIRSKFLEFFKTQDHQIFRSSPLIPAKDPTLLFVNAGMVQFKNVFLGQEDVGTKRATSSQKCLRVSGKHNDFENVGRTARHHTFFEMLGNFSFGDYFKKDAIRFGYDFLVNWMGLDPERFYCTVYKDDDEAEAIWREEIGIPAERVLRFGEKDNFWSMGDTGPCGPCSEILYDQGEAFGTGPEDVPGGEGDRYLELWNLVFMQYDRDDSGKMTPLPKPCVDTGMGLERIAAVVQGARTNYDSDLFSAIHAHTEQISGLVYGEDPEQTVSMRVIADHIRAATFLIGDAVLPSNEGRGYVLRRILRRAARHAVLIGLKKPFLYSLSGTVIDAMAGAYPELVERKSYIAKILKAEEERFLRTLENGLRILNEEIDRMKKADEGTLDGDFAFKLYDTFGFPLDLTEDIGLDKGFVVDNEGFTAAMERQRAASSKAWKGSGEAGMTDGLSELAQSVPKTEFLGYGELKIEAEITGILVEDKPEQSANEGDKVQIVTDKTPFYAEMGGQVGDTGQIFGPSVLATIENTFTPAGHMSVHQGTVTKGTLNVGDTVTLAVDPVRRDAIHGNHSATHLLHHALRQVLGPDVKQAGSLVGPNRLRFDFTYFSAIEPVELVEIERRVNAMIRENASVQTEEKDYQQAVKDGAVALFGEKYADDVRVVSMGPTMELCGGTHASRTGDIGAFVILSEGSIAAGVRRIEALTGEGAIEIFQKQRELLHEAAEKLKTGPADLPEKLERLAKNAKDLEKKVGELEAKLSSGQGSSLLDQAREVNGVKVLGAVVQVSEAKNLRTVAAQIRDKMGSGVLALGAEADGRAMLIVMVSNDLIPRFSAGNLIKPLAEKVGGKGGGRPDMAQAGGKDASNLEAAVNGIYELVT
jgi:alanyl-tRNA synthetase